MPDVNTSDERRSEHQKEICIVLNRLRNARPEFRDVGRFSKDAKIAPPTIKSVEKLSITPTIPIIERWLDACGGSLVRFFTDVAREVGAFKDDEQSIRINLGYEHFHRLLNGIIDNDDPYWIQSIEGNLYGVYMATGKALPAGVPAPPLKGRVIALDEIQKPPPSKTIDRKQRRESSR
jgi:hypothetical protein